ncbi:transporter [Tahibacter amnicola]|uniref:Transporter n=1 Tax=Tahibacter amnicola TaxID=2976241 RepID=A0ABY6BKH4_9GAMM|nr:transporter [Tahibacter amnicola]UXI70269.1 transporter [Tahibacter amnicola]
MMYKIALLLLLAATRVSAQAPVQRQSMDDAWWTGPMLANSASTLPKGHYLIEPYLYDVQSNGAFDRDGRRHSTGRSHGYGSLTYMTYGVTDAFSLSLIPTFGYNDPAQGPGSSGIGMGDLAVHAQYRLTQFEPGHWLPTLSVALQQTFPTGKHDRLGGRASDGLGSGARSTMLGVYSQTYLWMPNGRILRMRLNLTKTFSGDANLADASVYGTDDGFRGTARPGDTFVANAAWEYSITRNWVVALDAVYRRTGNTRVRGVDAAGSVTLFDSGSSRSFALAPAIEYNFNANVGVLFGVRAVVAGRNTSSHITPAIAVNIVR